MNFRVKRDKTEFKENKIGVKPWHCINFVYVCAELSSHFLFFEKFSRLSIETSTPSTSVVLYTLNMFLGMPLGVLHPHIDKKLKRELYKNSKNKKKLCFMSVK